MYQLPEVTFYAKALLPLEPLLSWDDLKNSSVIKQSQLALTNDKLVAKPTFQCAGRALTPFLCIITEKYVL